MSWSLAASRLADALDRSDEQCGLAETALTIALGEYPDLDVAACLETVEGFARAVRAHVAKGGPASGAGRAAHEVAALNHVLFERHGFRGDGESYYSPENSFLNRVIERRRGLPIALSILYADVAQRAGIPVEGVAFPGHFLVKHTGVAPALVIDPFGCGMLLTPERCRELLERTSEGRLAFGPHLLETATRRAIVGRALRNLKGYYLRTDDLPRALGVLNCLLRIAPDEPVEWRDRGLVRLRLDDSRGALRDLTQFLDMVPVGAQTREVEEAVTTLRSMIARMN